MVKSYAFKWFIWIIQLFFLFAFNLAIDGDGIKNAGLILQLMDLKRTRFISEMVNRIWSFQSLFFEEKTILTWQKCFRCREGKISSLQSETILATMRTIYRRMRKWGNRYSTEAETQGGKQSSEKAAATYSQKAFHHSKSGNEETRTSPAWSTRRTTTKEAMS